MSTRSSARNLLPPLDNSELTIRRRSRTDLTLLNNSEMAAEGNGDLPVPDLWTMEELSQPSLNGRGGPIAPISIQATNFGLKNDMIQQVQNSCQFHGLPGDDANKHLDKFLHVTQSIKVNGVTDDSLRLYLFPHSMTYHEQPPAGPPPQNNNGPPPMVRPNGQAPRSMEELCQPSIDGQGGPIATIPIKATDFGLRHHMIQQVQNLPISWITGRRCQSTY
nr:reverse transcriptase domain-containing protein [Tanacetum cinerariifolium]